jgi:hypothetical protein
MQFKHLAIMKVTFQDVYLGRTPTTPLQNAIDIAQPIFLQRVNFGVLCQYAGEKFGG